MGEILFLAHRIPYPPDKGDKIRSWNVLQHLLTRATVHVGAFVDDPADMAHEAFLKSLCGEVLLRPLAAKDRWKRGLRGLLRGEALSLALYYDRAMTDWVAQVMRQQPISSLVVFSSQMAPYALPHLEGRRGVMDFVDVDSEKWRQYADEARSGVRRFVYAREAARLRHFERKVAELFDASLLVSEAEASLFRAIAGPSAHTVLAVNNGVDFNYFDPKAPFEPRPPSVGPAILFSGAMDYRPNIDAVHWFAAEVWPRVRAAQPQATFYIVGSRPATEVRRLRGQEGIVVTGRVEDMRPYLAAANVVVAPLRIARGIQNKVLEAMAMARPIVATPAAFEGIDATVGEHLLVAERPSDFADMILDLIEHPLRARALGVAARRRVTERYAWTSNLAKIDELLGLQMPAHAGKPQAVAG